MALCIMSWVCGCFFIQAGVLVPSNVTTRRGFRGGGVKFLPYQNRVQGGPSELQVRAHGLCYGCWERVKEGRDL